ncbi:cell division cycle protein 23 homolog [Xenia sp. Carnegie-2017]|uniref:cell division cycle protein 23 homolog n=1 Tax=Xenia sp. Carnegie-2017 TaxID=2897299 RepID=UPI001F03D08F|nr:cell division cycle protein 23 homolog [Xenia sp. Carnegie-2017]XP_046857701.1 cell division cycle protein 23 homolog [Xenia sp. Carnegie-2017]
MFPLMKTNKMAVNLTNFSNLREIKKDLQLCANKCMARGLIHTAKWAADLSLSIQISLPNDIRHINEDPRFLTEYDSYLMGKTCFDSKEFERAAFYLENCTSDECYFLKIYSLYLAGEKKKNNEKTDILGPLEKNTIKNKNLLQLKNELSKNQKSLDGFSFYLFGVVLKELDLKQEALEMFEQSVGKEPLLWSSWLEIALLYSTKDKAKYIKNLPNHWMKSLFDAHVAMTQQQNFEALQMYSELHDHCFQTSFYILSQLALAQYNLKDFDVAVTSYEEINKIHPYCLENMDTYSNILYVKEMKPELSHLAHHCFEIDKYRVETCCVVANFYSLRQCHEKAILYFQRALRLNPRYLSAWTLMGHEYMEMKNTSAAIESYRQAIEVSPRDYRAWYGLGQTYEIMKMPLYSLYYFSEAQRLKPNDARMIIALGECYQKLSRVDEAKKCYRRAIGVGDVDGIAVLQLARLYERLQENEDACRYYMTYTKKADIIGVLSTEDVSGAYKFLSRHFINNKQYAEASKYAQKCCDYSETREDGKTMLREISELRSLAECTSTPVNCTLSESWQRPSTDVQISPMNLTFSP